jgi:hypothetical protein
MGIVQMNLLDKGVHMNITRVLFFDSSFPFTHGYLSYLLTAFLGGDGSRLFWALSSGVVLLLPCATPWAHLVTLVLCNVVFRCLGDVMLLVGMGRRSSCGAADIPSLIRASMPPS